MMRVRTFRALLAVLAMGTLTGCQNYYIAQRNVFSDDYGNVVSVEYGHSDEDHVNTFISPATGKEMEFKSRLVVVAHLPDGDKFTAWQCMNFLPRGTMYKTDNEKWMLLASGFACTIYERVSKSSSDYREVYRGILCDTTPVDTEDNPKWKTIKAPQNGRYSSKQKQEIKE